MRVLSPRRDLDFYRSIVKSNDGVLPGEFLLAGFVASHLIAMRLSAPVAKLRAGSKLRSMKSCSSSGATPSFDSSPATFTWISTSLAGLPSSRRSAESEAMVANELGVLPTRTSAYAKVTNPIIGEFKPVMEAAVARSWIPEGGQLFGPLDEAATKIMVQGQDPKAADQGQQRRQGQQPAPDRAQVGNELKRERGLHQQQDHGADGRHRRVWHHVLAAVLLASDRRAELTAGR